MTLDELKQNAYEFVKHIECNRGCGDTIELWSTPNGNWAAFNPMQRGSDKAVMHRETCSEQESERTTKKPNVPKRR